jgi:hypothetical protein
VAHKFHPEVNLDHQSYPSPSDLLDHSVEGGHHEVYAFGENLEELVLDLGSVESVKAHLRLLHRSHT